MAPCGQAGARRLPTQPLPSRRRTEGSPRMATVHRYNRCGRRRTGCCGAWIPSRVGNGASWRAHRIAIANDRGGDNGPGDISSTRSESRGSGRARPALSGIERHARRARDRQSQPGRIVGLSSGPSGPCVGCARSCFAEHGRWLPGEPAAKRRRVVHASFRGEFRLQAGCDPGNTNEPGRDN